MNIKESSEGRQYRDHNKIVTSATIRAGPGSLGAGGGGELVVEGDEGSGGRILIQQWAYHSAHRLDNEQRNESRGVTESQRPVLRSSRSCSTTLPPRSISGRVKKSSGSRPVPRSILPSRTSRSKCSSFVSACTSSATGFVPSRISILSPFSTASRYSPMCSGKSATCTLFHDSECTSAELMRNQLRLFLKSAIRGERGSPPRARPRRGRCQA
jgi:hypothetical protein